MTTYKNKITKILICLMLAFAFIIASFSTTFTRVFADETQVLTLSSLLTDHAEGTANDQEITNTLGITTDFGDALGAATTAGWSTPTYTGATIAQVNSVDFSSDGAFTYGDNPVIYNTIGTDGITDNKYGLLFLLNASGVAGIESPDIVVPAHALYVLTFNVKVAYLGNSSTNYGLNAKIIDQTVGSEKISAISMDAIKTTSEDYATYSFLIQGNGVSEKTVKLQLLFGNAVENTTGNATLSNQLGYAAVDTIRMFSVTSTQAAQLLLLTTKVKNAFLSNVNSGYVAIKNGYFNESINSQWNVETYTSINDLKPANWTHTTSADNTAANYGIIDTYATNFTAKKNALALNVVNPGNPTSLPTNTGHNNVLILNNTSATYQTLKSANITLAKSSYYEISFAFNTPAITDETNALNFYIVDSNNTTIYSSENMFSYTTYTGSNNEWTTFHAFISTASNAQTVNFIIKFGTETANSTGFAFVDDIRLISKTATNMFSNSASDTYVLTTEDGADTTYLGTGLLSFSDLEKLDTTNVVNRSLKTYKFVDAAVDDENDDEKETEDEEETETEPEANASLAWYIVPSALFGLCLILGLIIYYVRKIKAKAPKREKKKKNAYDRNRTLNKQVEKRAQAEKTYEKADIENQLKTVREEIANLETNYYENSKNKMALKAYVAKRERLQNREAKLIETLSTLQK